MAETPTRILFLDIDGVLNSTASIIATGSSWPKEDPAECNLDRVCCGLIQRAADECGLTICVHSSWASGSNGDYLRAVLREHGITASVVDLPPESFGGRDSRRGRILTALRILAPESYVVVDDIDMTPDFGDRMICTNADEGLRYADYVRILSVFEVQPRFVLL